MSLLTECFGVECTSMSLEDVKFLIKNTATATPEEKATMLKEFAAIRGISLSEQDYIDIGL